MKKYSILMADDEEVIRLTISHDLKKAGYDVTTAENGGDAIAKFKEGDFDLVITDLIMGGVDGIDVLREVKKTDPEMPVIILTGYGSLPTAIEALTLEAFDYLLKPCDRTALLLKVERCIESMERDRTIKIYEQILPMCCVCKKARDDTGKEPGTGEWVSIATYIEKISRVSVSHGYCPECAEVLGKEIKKIHERKVGKRQVYSNTDM